MYGENAGCQIHKQKKGYTGNNDNNEKIEMLLGKKDDNATVDNILVDTILADSAPRTPHQLQWRHNGDSHHSLAKVTQHRRSSDPTPPTVSIGPVASSSHTTFHRQPTTTTTTTNITFFAMFFTFDPK